MMKIGLALHDEYPSVGTVSFLRDDAMMKEDERTLEVRKRSYAWFWLVAHRQPLTVEI